MYHDVMCAVQCPGYKFSSNEILKDFCLSLIDQLPLESVISRSNHIPKMTSYLVDTCLMNLSDNSWGVIQISSTISI